MLDSRFTLFNKHLLSQGIIESIRLLDIGGAHSLDMPWSILNDNARLIHYSYDPFYKTKQTDRSSEVNVVYPFIVGNGTAEATDFYNCSVPSMSSCFPPNDDLNKHLLRPIDSSLRVDSESRHCESVIQGIKSVSIDQHFKPNQIRVDMIKIDTQGSEYDVLIGARNYISANSPLIIAETWTLERYKNIPLMHNIIGLAHDLGYIPASVSLASSAYWLTKHPVRCGNPTPSGYDILLVPLDRLLSCNMTARIVVPACALLELFGQRSLAINILEANMKEDPLYSQIIDCMYHNSKYEESLPDGQRSFFGLHY